MFAENNPHVKKSLRSLADGENINIFKREISVDSSIFENLFSESDSLYFNFVTEDLDFEKQRKVDEVYYIIENMLPKIEKQVIFLSYFLKKKQEVIGRLLKISQEMVCYYKKRAEKRIKLHYFFRSIDINDMTLFFNERITKKQKVAMLEYFHVHDLGKIAHTITKMEHRKKEIHYEAIGSRIKLGIKKLEELSKSENSEEAIKAKKYFDVFTCLKRYNSLYHSQSKKKVKRVIEG